MHRLAARFLNFWVLEIHRVGLDAIGVLRLAIPYSINKLEKRGYIKHAQS